MNRAPRTSLRVLHTAIATMLAFAVYLAPASSRAQAKSQPARTPVLVELFTSEGCSSCPPADALLGRLQQQQPVAGADIIVLDEHVDYWDQLGWRDRFSSHQYTDRQSGYAARLRLDSDYTPQMIVDGTDQFVGNDSSHALRAITAAARTPKAALALSSARLEGNIIAATVSAPAPATFPSADLYAVLVETMASTDVKRGENGGRTLHHVSVVRSMQRIGSLDTLTHAPLSFTLSVPKDANAANMRVVVFAQRSGQGAIIAATLMLTAPSAALQVAAR